MQKHVSMRAYHNSCPFGLADFVRQGIKIFTAVIGVAAGIWGIGKIRKKLAIKNHDAERKNRYYDLLLDWIDGLYGNRSIAEYLKKNGWHKAAIYGNGTMGFLLYEDLKKSTVSVEYFIDKNAKEVPLDIDDIHTISIDEIEQQTGVDVIIITPIHVYDEIKTDLEKNGINIPIISLGTIILEA